MDYSYDFAKIKANYPEKIGLEQMRVICHISKKTAGFLAGIYAGNKPACQQVTRRLFADMADDAHLLQPDLLSGKSLICTLMKMTFCKMMRNTI